jgi:uncharacterized protein involved in outer membrane biogenesis
MFRKRLLLGAVLVVLAGIGLVLVVRGRIGGDVVRQALERRLSEAVGEPVRIGSLGASFFPRVAVDLHGVSAGEPARATIEDVTIQTGLRGLLSRRVEDAAVIVSNGRIPIELAAGLVGAASSPTAAPDPSGGFAIVSVRTLAFRHVELVAAPHSLTVDLESSLAGDRLEVGRLVAESAGTRLEANGTLTSLARHEGRFTAHANQLDLDELLALASGLSDAASGAAGPDRQGAPAGAAPTPVDVTIDLDAPGGTLAGYPFGDLTATVHVRTGEVRLQPIAFGLFGGRFDGQLLTTTSGPAPGLQLEGSVAGLDVAHLLRETSGSTGLTGTLAGRVSLTGAGASTDDLLRGARGQGTVTVSNGQVPGLDMVRAVVLTFGKPAGAPPAGSGSAFSRLGGTFTLAGRTLRSEDLAFESRDFDMSGVVSVGTATGALDARMNVRLSRELTAQAGTDLRRVAQEDGRVVVPAVLSGTVADPSVSIDVASALSRALQNEMKRRVGSLLDRLIRK